MASSKPTAVHFSLIVFVMTTLILALVCYLNYKKQTEILSQLDAANDKANRAENDRRVAEDDITLLKRKLGYPDFPTIGGEEETNPNTVIGALKRDLAAFGREQVQPSPANPTVAATLQSLRSALNTSESHIRERQTELANVQTEMTQEQQAHMRRIAEIQESQSGSEKQLQDLVAQRNELVAEKDRDIGKWREEFRREQREKETLRDELDALRKKRDEESRDYERVIGYMRERLDKLEDLSFDKADGAIVRVDNTTRAVWINLGSDDGLRSQVTFSVYTKGHQGVGRGNADIKAKIEVTKIRGPHLAEARILSEDIARPIQADDPIYSPAWSKGQKEYFSFVGVVDMNGDEKSDRELLRSTLSNSGAAIELEVDDAGNRVPENGQLSVKSKFLVIGRLEDPTDYPGTDTQKQEEILKVIKEYEELTKEATRKGIKIVNFRDFLNYMGYEQQLRLLDRDSKGYPLKSGLTPTATVEKPDAANRLPIPKNSSRFDSSGVTPKSLSNGR